MTGSPYQQEEKAVIDAVLNLFGVSRTDSFLIPIPGTTPIVYIAAGEKKQVMDLLAAQREGNDGRSAFLSSRQSQLRW